MITKRNNVSPHDSQGPRAKEIQDMFSGIAGRYDFLNRLLSLGIDTRWRKRCIKVLKQKMKSAGSILDLAAGTGDLALALEKHTSAAFPIIAADFSHEMLKILKKKKGTKDRISIVTADGLSLPFRSDTFVGTTIGFGIRNFTDRPAALKELLRVLKPGGVLAILEFSIPQRKIFRSLYLFYFEKILPLIGGLFSSRSAYTYLPESVRKFPPPEKFSALIHDTGFTQVEFIPLTRGIAFLYTAEKPVTDPSERNR
ncbi:MAG: bifunctional demethylmenaquinone methyltransferase/2-methoxy-6-polyprenyl-1,4-benzoquinol methylase UbiE [Deltaproteobacteria bacterium]|nr:bifunctional demethylmenaquinone methyltransferase/2-methoxy-6-polyprenyl-1,4-benzoquinol methylase UbiE [Deltaproteobacteria bacterium]